MLWLSTKAMFTQQFLLLLSRLIFIKITFVCLFTLLFKDSRLTPVCSSTADLSKLRPVGQVQPSKRCYMVKTDVDPSGISKIQYVAADATKKLWKFRFVLVHFIYIILPSIPHPTNIEPARLSNFEPHFGLWAKKLEPLLVHSPWTTMLQVSVLINLGVAKSTSVNVFALPSVEERPLSLWLRLSLTALQPGAQRCQLSCHCHMSKERVILFFLLSLCLYFLGAPCSGPQLWRLPHFNYRKVR